MDNYKKIWNEKHKVYFNGTIEHDDWLDNYEEIINHTKRHIIDLGCGVGNNAFYLTKKGKKVIACDYSDEALKIISDNLPQVQTKQFDMKDEIPFESDFTDLIIADLSLHYFTFKETVKILEELKRVLVSGGYLIFRVNSINDVNHGAMQGIELEKHYYEVNGMKKRFFDKEDLIEFFSSWIIIELKEELMTRYTKPKIIFKGLVRK